MRMVTAVSRSTHLALSLCCVPLLPAERIAGLIRRNRLDILLVSGWLWESQMNHRRARRWRQDELSTGEGLDVDPIWAAVLDRWCNDELVGVYSACHSSCTWLTVSDENRHHKRTVRAVVVVAGRIAGR